MLQKQILSYAKVMIVLLGLTIPAIGQDKKEPIRSFKSGLGIIAPDSIFSVNFRFRMQNRAAYTTKAEDDFSANEIEARVRRLRMRIDGFLVNPKLTYYIQLSFSRGDMDWSVRDNSAYNNSPNVVRDAVVYYKPVKGLTLFFGQTKLPGNRQRVVSSGELQFADRSVLNANFNIDRDFGFQSWYEGSISGFTYLVKGAVTSGEGRNSNSSNYGLAYTGRLELLPLGKFTNKGDYFEGDLERESKPKLSLAAGYHYNESAVRAAGVLGRDLYQSRNLSSFIADVLFKYGGFAFTAEYANRTANNPLTTNSLGDVRHIYVGEAKLFQGSYIFKNNVEIAGRYAVSTPFLSIQTRELQTENYTLGVTKYLNKHRVKVQGNVGFETRTNKITDASNSNWIFTFQTEIGI